MSDWRPFEPSREAVKAASEHNRCNLHDDCETADEKCRAAGGRVDRDGFSYMRAFHCHTEDCEDCFGC